MRVAFSASVALGLSLILTGISGEALSAQSLEADPVKLRRQVLEKFEAKDYEWLESSAEALQAGPFDPLETFPRLEHFYSAFTENLNDDAACLRRLSQLQDWQRAKPESVAPRTALGKFYTHYAWEARGSGWASTVTEEGWRLFRERIALAKDALYGKEDPARIMRRSEPVKDPANYAARIVVAMAESDDEAMSAAFREGATLYPAYYPIYERVQRCLLPRWGGKPGQGARFAAESADKLGGPNADAFYALQAEDVLKAEEEDFFEQSGFDLDRMLRGYDQLAAPGANRAGYYAHRAAFVAAASGKMDETRRRLLAAGPAIYSSAWLNPANLQKAQRESGALGEFQKLAEMEARGQLPEAQAGWLALTPGRTENAWLKSFAKRNGLAELYAAFPGATNPAKPVAECSPDQLYELTEYHFAAGNLAQFREYAEAFDRQRPWNLTGKGLLYWAAVIKGDAAEKERARQAIAKFETKRKNYQIAVDYLNGKTPWKEGIAAMKEDGYRVQAILAMAAHALAQEKLEESRQILEAVNRRSLFSDLSAMSDSLQFGALYRGFNPLALPAK